MELSKLGRPTSVRLFLAYCNALELLVSYKSFSISAIFALVLTILYLCLLKGLAEPISITPLRWIADFTFAVGMALGMNIHSPSYAYLIPISFFLFLLCSVLISYLVAFIKRMIDRQRVISKGPVDK